MLNPVGTISGTVVLPSSEGNTLLFAPLMVIGEDGELELFNFITAGFGDHADQAAEEVLLNLTRYVPNERTVISLPVNEIIEAPLTIVFTPFVRVAIVTPSFCHSYA